MKSRILYSILGLIFLIIGFSFILNSMTGIHGLITDISPDTTKTINSLIGILFVAVGFFLLSKTKRKTKAQAAMEFMMTYGWAILAAVIVIGALYLFGVFTPSIPNQFFLSPPILPKGHSIAADTSNDPGEQPGILAEIQNSDTYGITITEAVVAGTNNGNDVTCIYEEGDTIASGDSIVIVIACDGPLAPATEFSGDITITYTKSGGVLDLTLTGTISGMVSEKQLPLSPPPGPV